MLTDGKPLRAKGLSYNKAAHLVFGDAAHFL
jgi:hypothetical protein